jgi:hypothetical protein
MKQYKICVSIPLGNGYTNTKEKIIDLHESLTSNEVEEECITQVWEILNNEGVETSWEEIREEE